jgi:flagellar hook-associated protein 1 FlgK
MGLSQALSTAMSGIRANQAALALVSSNVANSETPGYVRKTINQVATGGGGVQTLGVNRTLDEYVQTQLRTETSGASYASVRANFLNNLQSVYGDPDSTSTLEAAFNTLTSSLQALSTSPDSQSARTAVLNAAQAMAQQLNSASQGIQSLRGSAESGLNSAVAVANNAMAQIAAINKQLQGTTTLDTASASLMDQRDQYITQLSSLMDIRVITDSANQVQVYTGNGVQLVSGMSAAQISFNAQGTVTPNTVWDADPAKSNLGTLTLNLQGGGSIDLVATGAIRSGSMAAYLDMRDNTLVQAQAQVDQLAAAMAGALSDKTTAMTADGAGAYSVDTSTLKPGNAIHLSYTDTVTGQQHNLSIIGVSDPSVLPLSNSATVDPGDEVIGIDLSGGAVSIAAQLNAALGGAHLQFSNPSGTTLRIENDGAPNGADINAVSTTTTATSLVSGDPQLALFTDGGNLYTGAITAGGSQQTGFAGRITVNAGLLADPSRLIAYTSTTASGDTTRSDFILSQLTSGSYAYSASTGVGSTASPFKGTLLNFTQQFLGMQANTASTAQQVSDGQNVVLATLQKKMDSTSGVNMDEEMANLLALQNAYAANARVMSTVNSMFQSLMQVL